MECGSAWPRACLVLIPPLDLRACDLGAPLAPAMSRPSNPQLSSAHHLTKMSLSHDLTVLPRVSPHGLFVSRSLCLPVSLSHGLTVSRSHCLTVSLSRGLIVSRSHRLTEMSLSRNLAISPSFRVVRLALLLPCRAPQGLGVPGGGPARRVDPALL